MALRHRIMFSHFASKSNHVFAFCFKIESCFRHCFRTESCFRIPRLTGRLDIPKVSKTVRFCYPGSASGLGIESCFRISLRNRIMFSHFASGSNHVFVYRTGIKSCFRVLLAESAFRILHKNRIRFSSLDANRAIGRLRSCGMSHFSTPESISPLVAACLAQTTARVSESRSVRLELGTTGQDRQTPCLWNMFAKISCNRIQHPLSSMSFPICGSTATPFAPTPFEVPRVELE